jgi:predicted DCC family thiol-disulfide oxidoreductase YuxK
VERALVLYDVDCGFCRWVLGILLAWDARGALRPVAIQDEEGQRLLARLPEEERLQSWHLAFPEGRLESAGPALAHLFDLLPAGAPVAFLARLLGPVTDWSYDTLAANRAVPGRMLPTSAVRRATERIRERSAPDSLIQDDVVAARCSTRPPAPAPAPRT